MKHPCLLPQILLPPYCLQGPVFRELEGKQAFGGGETELDYDLQRGLSARFGPSFDVVVPIYAVAGPRKMVFQLVVMSKVPGQRRACSPWGIGGEGYLGYCPTRILDDDYNTCANERNLH